MANEDRTSRGWIRLWRGMEDSWVFSSGHCTFRLWVWLLLKANHSDGYQTNGRTLGRGEVWTSVKAVQEALRYEESGGSKTFTKKAVEWAFHCLRERGMIEAVARTPRGFIIRIVNYDRYQSNETFGGGIPENAPGMKPDTLQDAEPGTLQETETAVSSSKDGAFVQSVEDKTGNATGRTTGNATGMHDTRTGNKHREQETTTTAREGGVPLSDMYLGAEYERFTAVPGCGRVSYDGFVAKTRVYPGADIQEALEAFALNADGGAFMNSPLGVFGAYLERSARERDGSAAGGRQADNGLGGRNSGKKRGGGLVITDAMLALPC